MTLRLVGVAACAALLAAAPVLAQPPAARLSGAVTGFTLDQVTAYPFPNELAAARRANRIAWAVNAAGKRNVYVAEAPSWGARKVTAYEADDAQELTSVQLTPDGSYVVFVRGGDHGSNWDDALPVNPAGLTSPVRVQVWSVPFAGGEPKLLRSEEHTSEPVTLESRMPSSA